MWVPAAKMVGLGRVELPTSPLSGVRSNQLSYRPSVANHVGHSTWLLPRRPSRPKAWSPAALTILIQFKKGFRGQRLNMLGSYAAHDHYVNLDQAKKACIRIPACTVRNGTRRVDEHSSSPLARFTSGAVRIRGRKINAIISLLERR